MGPGHEALSVVTGHLFESLSVPEAVRLALTGRALRAVVRGQVAAYRQRATQIVPTRGTYLTQLQLGGVPIRLDFGWHSPIV